MGQPLLVEYLLKLSTDKDELERFWQHRNHGPDDFVDYLTKKPFPGLTKEQAKILDGRDSHAVVLAAIEDLNTNRSRDKEHAFYGIPVTIICDVNSVQQHHFDVQKHQPKPDEH